jgi:hypothetical protein
MKYRYLKAGDVRRAGDEWVMQNSARCPECGAYQDWTKVYESAVGKRITKFNAATIFYRRPVVSKKASRPRPPSGVKLAVK